MPHTLLLADDSATIQRVVELTFANEDIDVVTVGDGTKAIEAIERDEPDIVLADVSMPGRDGYEVASFVRRDPTRDRIPVVLLTGAFEPLDESRCDAIGRHEVLVKPIEPRQVVGKVRELLDLLPKDAPAAVAAGREARGGPARGRGGRPERSWRTRPRPWWRPEPPVRSKRPSGRRPRRMRRNRSAHPCRKSGVGRRRCGRRGRPRRIRSGFGRGDRGGGLRSTRRRGGDGCRQGWAFRRSAPAVRSWRSLS